MLSFSSRYHISRLLLPPSQAEYFRSLAPFGPLGFLDIHDPIDLEGWLRLIVVVDSILAVFNTNRLLVLRDETIVFDDFLVWGGRSL